MKTNNKKSSDQATNIQYTGWYVSPTQSNDHVLNKCTLIIPTFKRPKSLISLLEQLRKIDVVPEEVIIVDGTPEEVVEKHFLSWVAENKINFYIKFIHSPSGLTRQRNIGIEASTGEIIFFLDDDCVPQDGYFKSIYDVFLQDKDSLVGGVAGSIINEMDRPLSFRWNLRMRLNLVPKDGVPGKYYPNATSVPLGLMPLFTGNIPTDILPGGASSFRKEVFSDQHFSEFFTGYAQGEDLEMSLRVKEFWQLRWCGDAHVLHLHTPLGRPQPFAKGKMEIYNRYFIWKRYTPKPSIICRLKFWSDVNLIAFLDFSRFLLKPWHTQPIIHFLGVISGAIICIFTPPQYDEPPLVHNLFFNLQTFQKITMDHHENS